MYIDTLLGDRCLHSHFNMEKSVFHIICVSILQQTFSVLYIFFWYTTW